MRDRTVPERCRRGAREVPERCRRGARKVPERCQRGARGAKRYRSEMERDGARSREMPDTAPPEVRVYIVELRVRILNRALIVP